MQVFGGKKELEQVEHYSLKFQRSAETKQLGGISAF